MIDTVILNLKCYSFVARTVILHTTENCQLNHDIPSLWFMPISEMLKHENVCLALTKWDSGIVGFTERLLCGRPYAKCFTDPEILSIPLQGCGNRLTEIKWFTRKYWASRWKMVELGYEPRFGWLQSLPSYLELKLNLSAFCFWLSSNF